MFYFWGNKKYHPMKKSFLLLAILSIVACKQEPEKPKDYVTFSGKITNKNSDSIMIASRDFSKTIMVNADGTFKDTLKVAPGMYYLTDFKESSPIFLKNGYEISLTLNTEQFDETLNYSGIGSENSNYLAKHALLQEELFKDLDELDDSNFESTFNNISQKFSDYYNSSTDIDSLLIGSLKRDLGPMLASYKNYYGGKLALKKEFPAGAPSPTFEGYENYKGGKTSLSDLKGKYAYIDVWATWCGPCKAEIPFLKQIEKQYHGKPINFVSISIDRAKDHDAWKQMVEEKELGGIQLFADNDWGSEFVKNYKINGIPRFILIDPNGNVVTPDAPRPSDPKLVALFDELKI